LSYFRHKYLLKLSHRHFWARLYAQYGLLYAFGQKQPNFADLHILAHLQSNNVVTLGRINLVTEILLYYNAIFSQTKMPILI